MKKDTDKYETDLWLSKMYPSDYWFDPCPIEWVEGDANAFDYSWYDEVMYHNYIGVFVNPPYSNPKPWVEKAIFEAGQGAQIVLLLKHDSSTEWYRLLHQAGAKFLMVNGRLKHRTGNGAAFPSVLAVL